ncbi:hypothetical protein ACN38_g12885 [Penicillium nordicum]|uniref:Uncharacterized protein n=1 Tax=Penicillium nordicum TaxID=229535 RepID=A0A0M8NSH5_9EURO|nr:hypothetical protein ACN38_g12885 [Penicillium nordicum]
MHHHLSSKEQALGTLLPHSSMYVIASYIGLMNSSSSSSSSSYTSQLGKHCWHSKNHCWLRQPIWANFDNAY